MGEHRKCALGAHLASDERDERSLHAFEHLLVHVWQRQREVQENLRGCEHHRAVRVAKPVLERVHDVERFLLALRFIQRDEVQHLALVPLVEVLDAIDEPVHERFGDEAACTL